MNTSKILKRVNKTKITNVGVTLEECTDILKATKFDPALYEDPDDWEDDGYKDINRMIDLERDVREKALRLVNDFLGGIIASYTEAEEELDL